MCHGRGFGLPLLRNACTSRFLRFLTEYLQEMVSKCVVEVATSPLLWQSRLFTVTKRAPDRLRVILYMHVLNWYIKCPHFKMLTLKDVKLLLLEGFYTVSLDLKG